MVPPRYGSGLVGGAENLVGALARKADAAGMDIEIATTCAASTSTWANELPAGESVEHGLCVRRFEVSARDAARHGQLASILANGGRLSTFEETDLMATSVWSEDLQAFIDREGPGYDAIVFAPYLFGTTFWGAQAWPGKTAIIPCLHDEPYAYLPSVQAVLRSSAVLMFNAGGEERLARRLLGDDITGRVVGMGFDPPARAPEPGFSERYGLGKYVLYAGRLEEGKRVDVAAEYFAAFARRHDPALKMVMIGAGSWRPPPEVADNVVVLGFLSADEKRAAMAEAVALVNPSELESFSIVILEAWLEQTPVLVAAGSEVMADHCADSGGGLTFSDEQSFHRAMLALLESKTARDDLGDRGRAYVEQRYGWAAVLDRFEAALACVSSSPAARH